MDKNNKKNNGNIKIIKGNKNIIISAPHSTMHKREGLILASETRTGHLVRKIAETTDIYGIYKIKAELNDANWDKDSEYKQAITNIVKNNNIKILLDIHGMAAYREPDICIGINAGKNIKNRYDILEKMVSIFKKHGFEKISVDEPFSAANENCVSTYIAKKCKIIAFQIEINRKYRSSQYQEFIKYSDLENALMNIIEMLNINDQMYK